MRVLILLICTGVFLLVAVQCARSEKSFSVADIQAENYLVGWHDIESYEQTKYRWSSTDAALVLDGFWSRPTVISLRMTAPRPPSAPVATMNLQSGIWKSDAFVVSDGWRNYHVLMPMTQSYKQTVWLATPPFIGTHDNRHVGVALSHAHAALPTALPLRFSFDLALLQSMLLPVLMYWVIQRLIAYMSGRKKHALSFGVGLLCFASVLLFVAWIVYFPLGRGHLFTCLWVAWVLLVGLLLGLQRPACLYLFVLALVPRILLIGSFVTIDEWKWFNRSENFLLALQTGDYANTNQTGHPGVTTMWMGTVGVVLHHTFADLGLETHVGDTRYRTLLRLPVGVMTSLCIVGGYLVLLRLFDKRIALLATVLWALDPFVVAHSQLLHLDALLTSFMVLSLLAAWAALGGRYAANDMHAMGVDWRMLIVSAIAGGLAFLTKSPSALLVPMIGLLVVAYLLPHTSFRQLTWVPFKHIALVLIVWASIAGGVWVVFWPLAWVDLPATFLSILGEVTHNAAIPHGMGNFFMGHPVDNPGIWYYPVALLFRLTPWVLIGIIVATIGAGYSWYMRLHKQKMQHPYATVSLLLLFVLFFVVAMSMFPKKFDRYMLPVFPLLAIVAAIGWGEVSKLVEHRIAKGKPMVMWVLGVFASITIVWYHPYELAYYNPLAGGGPVAVRSIVVGWGEGLEQAGAYIMSQPDVNCEHTVLSWYDQLMDYYVCNEVLSFFDSVSEPHNMDYVVFYVNQVQRGVKPDNLPSWVETIPVYTVRIHGIDYAYVYRVVQIDGASACKDSMDDAIMLQ